MQRHEWLQDLSREHHLALRLALAARRAVAAGDPAQIRAAATGSFQALDPTVGQNDPELIPAQTALDGTSNNFVIFDNQDESRFDSTPPGLGHNISQILSPEWRKSRKF